MTRLVCLGLAASLLLAAPAWADDPLDKVTGTEAWREGAASDPRVEWRDWLRARAAWRAARRMLRIEGARNRQLEALRRRGRPRAGAVQQVMRSAPRGWRDSAPARQPGTTIRITRGTGDADDADEDAGKKVPVERLDDKGQALDKEGDQLFDKPTRRRR